MKLLEQQQRFTYLIALFIIKAIDLGYQLAGREWQRTEEQHQANLKAGKSQAKKSQHTSCLAIDFVAYKDDIYLSKTTDYQELGELWESLDPECVWGGRFGDRPETAEIEGWDGGHFQYGMKAALQYYKYMQTQRRI